MRSRSMWLLAAVVGAFGCLTAPAGAEEGPAAHHPPPGARRLAAPSAVGEERTNLPAKRGERADPALKSNGLDLQGSISANWGESGVRIQVDRVSNTSGSTSPELLLRLWATPTRPVFGDTLHPYVLGSASLGTLPSGGHFDNVDTGYVAYTPPPDGCYYVTVALETVNSGDSYTYWSFAVLASNGEELFPFGSTGCGVTPAQTGALYATENSSNAVLYRIDDFATSPRVTILGNTGLGVPTIAIDPTSGILYAIDVSDGRLYQVDAQTGRTRLVGSTGLTGASPVALAFDAAGSLFAWGHDDGVLYRVDKSTAAATYVGYTGYSAGGDLAFGLDGTLYGSTGSSLVRIDPRTGAGSYIGAFGVDGVFGLAVAADGALYAGQDTSSSFSGSSRLYRVNRANAQPTLVGDLDESLGDLAIRGGGAAPPVAAFTWSPSNPTTGQAVQFTDQSGGNPTSWQWDLDGDGVIDSTARNPVRTYTAAGSYNVTLTACNAAGCAASTRALTVTAKPTLKVSGPGSGTALQALAFTATASGCTPNPFTWSWGSDGDLMRFDGGLWPPSLGSLPLSGPTTTANLGWSKPGSHTLQVTNSACPGAQGSLTIDIQAPGNETVQIFPKTLDRSLPTVVFCHGLQLESFDLSGKTLWSCMSGCDSSEIDHPAGDLPASRSVNKVQYVWSGAGQGKTDAFVADYVRAWQYTDDAGRQLANKLVDALGSNYDKPVQLVGHSLGTAVCGRAAVEFLKREPKVAQLQLTVLDRPDHVHKLLHDSPYPNFEARFGFAPDYFPSLLATAKRPGLDLRLDNYWSTTGSGVGDVTQCLDGVKVYNHRAPAGLLDPGDVGNRYFRHESIAGIDLDHSGVHQWYRWTGDPNGIAAGKGDSAVCAGAVFTSPRNLLGDVFNTSLSPCEAGWKASILGPSPASFHPDSDCDPATVHPEPVPVCIGVGRPCLASTGRVLEKSEAVAAATTEREGQVAVALPVYARNLLFTLEVSNPSADSSAAVLLDGVPLWSGSLGSFPADRQVGIGPLPLYGLTGSRTLTLKVLGPASSTVRLSNLQVQKILVPCEAGDALCVAAHRFRIEADWTDHKGNSGHANPRTIASDASGFLWFFDQSNLELIVKVLNACGFPGSPRFWVYAAGLTDVEVRLTVTDTVTGAVKIYTNPQGTPFQPIQDTDAFATCRPGDAALAAEAAPRPDDRKTVGKSGLGQGRFTVFATWRTAQGQTGAGQFVPVTDNSGYFWFFDPGNVETVVKVLDGCGLNSRYWVFAAGLTNVQVDLVVTDTWTGAQVSYHNPLGQGFQPVQDTSAFATCP